VNVKRSQPLILQRKGKAVRQLSAGHAGWAPTPQRGSGEAARSTKSRSLSLCLGPVRRTGQSLNPVRHAGAGGAPVEGGLNKKTKALVKNYKRAYAVNERWAGDGGCLLKDKQNRTNPGHLTRQRRRKKGNGHATVSEEKQKQMGRKGKKEKNAS